MARPPGVRPPCRGVHRHRHQALSFFVAGCLRQTPPLPAGRSRRQHQPSPSPAVCPLLNIQQPRSTTPAQVARKRPVPQPCSLFAPVQNQQLPSCERKNALHCPLFFAVTAFLPTSRNLNPCNADTFLPFPAPPPLQQQPCWACPLPSWHRTALPAAATALSAWWCPMRPAGRLTSQRVRWPSAYGTLSGRSSSTTGPAQAATLAPMRWPRPRPTA